METTTLNIHRIEAFLAVMQARSISRAAVRLDVAQSVISRHLGALEAQIGCRLFERTGRGVSPTPAAERLAPRLRGGLDEMLRATAEAAEVGNQPSGVVRVGMVPSAAHPMIGLLYQRVATQLPRVRLQFVEGFSNALEDQAAKGFLDLAVINRFTRVVRRGEERLGVIDSMAIGPPGWFTSGATLTFRQLAEFPLVLAARPNGRAPLEQAARRAGVSLQVLVESDSLMIMKELVRCAGLCTVLPWQAVHEELELGRVSAARLVRPTVPRALSLIHSPLGSGAAIRAVAHELRGLASEIFRAGHRGPAPPSPSSGRG